MKNIKLVPHIKHKETDPDFLVMPMDKTWVLGAAWIKDDQILISFNNPQEGYFGFRVVEYLGY